MKKWTERSVLSALAIVLAISSSTAPIIPPLAALLAKLKGDQDAQVV